MMDEDHNMIDEDHSMIDKDHNMKDNREKTAELEQCAGPGSSAV
jgi:hypothetical protein